MILPAPTLAELLDALENAVRVCVGAKTVEHLLMAAERKSAIRKAIEDGNAAVGP